MIFLWACTHARRTMYSHPPSCFARHPPPHRPTHANYVCAGPGGGGGHSGVVPFGNIVRPPRRALHDTPPPTEPPTQTMFARGPVSCHPSAEGNFGPRRYVASFPPLEGWAQPGVVREFKNVHLVPILCHSRAGGNRVY